MMQVNFEDAIRVLADNTNQGLPSLKFGMDYWLERAYLSANQLTQEDLLRLSNEKAVAILVHYKTKASGPYGDVIWRENQQVLLTVEEGEFLQGLFSDSAEVKDVSLEVFQVRGLDAIYLPTPSYIDQHIEGLISHHALSAQLAALGYSTWECDGSHSPWGSTYKLSDGRVCVMGNSGINVREVNRNGFSALIAKAA